MQSKIRNIINFITVFILSAFGYEFLFFILLLFVFNLTKKPFDVGIFTAITFFPSLFSPFFGTLADKFNRKKLFAVGALLIALLIFILAFINNIIYLYIMWFFLSCFFRLIVNARTTVMTEILSYDNFLWGNSIVLISLNLSKLLAPLAGGFLSKIIGIKILLFISSGIYLSASFLSLFIIISYKNKNLEKAFNPIVHIIEGFKYIKNNNSLKFLTITGIFWKIFLGLQVSLFIVYVKSSLSMGDAEFGIFMSIIGFGSIIGSIFGPMLFKKFDYHRLIIIGLIIHSLSFTLLGLINNYNLALIVVSSSFAIFYFTVVGLHSLRDNSINSDFRGRVYGSVSAILTIPGIVSMLIGSWLSGIYGVNLVFIFTGILASGSMITSYIYYHFKKASDF